jgi:hypothetical protein
MIVSRYFSTQWWAFLRSRERRRGDFALAESGSFARQIDNDVEQYRVTCRLGGVVVSVLTTGPEDREFEPGQGDGFLRATKIRSTPSFGRKRSWKSHLVRFYGMLKISWSATGTDRLNSHFLRPFSYSLQRCLCWQDRHSSGYCQSALVDKLGVSLSQYHHTEVHITITGERTIGPQRSQFWDVALAPS